VVRSVLEVLEQARLEIGSVDAAGRCDQRANLAASDETPATELDALDLPGSGPAPDRRGSKAHVRGGQDLGGFLEADPVGSGHPQASLDVDALAPFESVDEPPPLFPEPPDSFEPARDEPSPEPDECSLEPGEPSLEAVEPPDSDAAAAFVFVPLELDRSFLAQPEPLKWTDGATKALRRVSSAPQAGQNFGAGASIPWMNSVRVEHFEQT
jgi:hypothetical protein